MRNVSMPRKLKRNELVQRIIEKAGLPVESKTPGYLSIRQMQALLLWIEKNDHDWKCITKTLNDLKERANDFYGRDQSKSSELEDI